MREIREESSHAHRSLAASEGRDTEEREREIANDRNGGSGLIFGTFQSIIQRVWIWETLIQSNHVLGIYLTTHFSNIYLLIFFKEPKTFL